MPAQTTTPELPSVVSFQLCSIATSYHHRAPGQTRYPSFTLADCENFVKIPLYRDHSPHLYQLVYGASRKKRAMQTIEYNKRFFIENYSHADDDDELYLNYDDWSLMDTMSVKSATSSNGSPNNNNNNNNNSNDMEASGQRLSLAYEMMSQVPRKVAEKFSRTTTILDLSYNNFKDLSFLSYFRQLNTLILDHNIQPDEKSFPTLPNLEVLWLNHCDIANVQRWVYRVRDCCPSLRILSLLGNPGATSSFNGNSTLEHNDYRMMVIGVLPQLRHLDDAEVTASQRAQARQFRHNTYNIGQTPYNIFESVGRGEQMGRKAALRRPRRVRANVSDDS
ncbi:uncharacterized protein LOC128736813 [Sabethes cyaneus]|uniref:uncharacterized protein LOC128736813 n=1 Tax=Sabethes cyaneus TaxID=53552 RepID=UPI00237DFAA2|nr:uncharacterized protein LOC128736813 [Sabethes cyaneus]